MGPKIIDIAFQLVGGLDRARIDRSRRSQRTLVVTEDTPAAGVAHAVESGGAKFVVVTDPSGELRGVVFPASVVSRVRRVRKSSAGSLSAIIEEIANDPEEAAKNFRHEYLTRDRPDTYWCEGGQHYVDRCPCEDHHGSPCKREKG